MLTLTRAVARGPVESPFTRGLAALINFNDPSSRPRERLSGVRPVAHTGTLARNERGEPISRYSGSLQYTEFADSAALRKPTTAFTVYSRLKMATAAEFGAPFGMKSANSTATSWGGEVYPDHFVCYMNTGVKTEVFSSGVLPTAKWAHIFQRWASGGPMSLESYYDGGAVANSRTQSGNVSGTIVYDTAVEAGALIFHWDKTNPSAVADQSYFALWNRRLTDGELLRLAHDPEVLFGRTFLSAARVFPLSQTVMGQPGAGMIETDLDPTTGAIQTLDATMPADRGGTLTIIRGGVPDVIPLAAGATDSEPINSTDPQDPEYIRFEPDPEG